MKTGRIYLLIVVIYSFGTLACVSTQPAATLLQSEDIQLACPKARYNSSLFAEEVEVQFDLDYPGREIHFTTDGSTPTIKSNIYKDKIKINSSIVLSAIATHPIFKASEVVQLEFLKANLLTSLKSAKLSRQPSDKYKGGGAESLFDLEKGTDNFRESAWMGYNGGELTIDVELASTQDIRSIKVSMLSNPGAWIFFPEKVNLQISEREYQTTIKIPGEAPPASQRYINIPIDPMNTKKFTLHISAVSSLPDWHQGKGNPAWMFIDEILIN